ncbi:transcriptional regulator [Rhizobium leguminosarum bv. trifolii]|uniref:Transcriptional regulator n=1 Tax=Rhizobium leguminosarum bv. trifolii TaxID=386 RepID=A0A3E1BM45_RHILT|nr:LysR family transcriptional regulator [Rhizobium leguminosarum]RFB94131.1 transcriptional regulator [Rhizobium leguminosarum bv. trifolii]RFB94345.1 transcriptional regulator [Rhizobium leguminosarum bv. trifolii]
MDWNDLKFFLAVAESRSLSAASRRLGVSTSTVSRRITALEQALGLSLFRHHFDGYELTEAGLNLQMPAEQAEASLKAFERSAREGNDHLSGVVRIDAPELLGQQILLPNLAGFMQDHPGIRLDIRSSVRPVQLATQQSDIVIRIVPPERGSYRMRSVGKVAFGLYADRNYLKAHGTPSSDRDLHSHRVIGWNDELRYLSMAVWLDELFPDLRPAMRLGSFTAQLTAVESGLGIAVLPCFAARRTGLVPVLEGIPRLTLDLWLLVQDQAGRTPRVQTVKEHLVKILIENADQLEG